MDNSSHKSEPTSSPSLDPQSEPTIRVKRESDEATETRVSEVVGSLATEKATETTSEGPSRFKYEIQPGETHATTESEPTTEKLEDSEQKPVKREPCGSEQVTFSSSEEAIFLADSESDGSEYESEDSNTDGEWQPTAIRKARCQRVKKSDPDCSEDKTPRSTSPTKGIPDKCNARRPPAASAREFWIRWSEDEERKRKEQQPRKRKPEFDELNAFAKIQKTEKNGSVEEEAPSMPAIQATTHADQIAKIKANMAQGGDTRRTATQKKDLLEAVSSFGFKRIKADNGNWKPKSMHTGLLHYQLTLAAWMCKREACGDPSGGLVADEMGMGKTVVSLACMSEHQAEASDVQDYCKATLVVVPNHTVATQWKNEIQKHCKRLNSKFVKIYRHKDSDGKRRSYSSKFAVITTYHEIIHSYPSPGEIKLLEEKYQGDEKSFSLDIQKKVGVLFKLKWYRVILDEAHHIRNASSHSAFACSGLRAKYRWCLSGTPLANTPIEFFPYLKFLRCSFTDTLKDFKNKYIRGNEANQNFEALVSLIMYRRTKKDTFLTYKILDLPGSTSQDLWIPPSQEEEIISRAVVNCYRRILEESDGKSLAEEISCDDEIQRPESETVNSEKGLRHRAMGYTLLQTVSHPFNLERMFRNIFKREEIRQMSQELSNDSKRPTLLEHLQSIETSGVSVFRKGLQKLAEFQQPAFGGRFDMDRLLQLAENEVHTRDKFCSSCNKVAVNAVPSLNCDHILCGRCENKFHRKNPKDKYCPADNCAKEFVIDDSDITSLNEIMKEARDDHYQEPAADSNKARIAKKPEKNGFFTASCYKGGQGADIPPSAKLSMAMAVILQWREEFPDDKIIVFTQFVMTGKVLGWMLQAAGYEFLYFYGEVSPARRDKAVWDFRNDPKKNIMLVGLRAGAEGLNLTSANRVILIDPWWNKTAEQQAFGRVERIGQQKISHLVRILTTTNIDKKIADMQVDKSTKIDYALQDDGHTAAELDDEQLQKLFAPVSKPREEDRDIRNKARRSPGERINKKI